ncbi:Uncharacterized protein FWK35_00005329 [Aphis craccivora]|uniref:Uncharacterized protein n=1 Tax=Aphis craccivora TaxID=307492 RepID=A0A6G0Z723_APHCR|nr:Uncharacterized protein FWK35_00005329 [Aphis craccivora]
MYATLQTFCPAVSKRPTQRYRTHIVSLACFDVMTTTITIIKIRRGNHTDRDYYNVSLRCTVGRRRRFDVRRAQLAKTANHRCLGISTIHRRHRLRSTRNRPLRVIASDEPAVSPGTTAPPKAFTSSKINGGGGGGDDYDDVCGGGGGWPPTSCGNTEVSGMGGTFRRRRLRTGLSCVACARARVCVSVRCACVQVSMRLYMLSRRARCGSECMVRVECLLPPFHQTSPPLSVDRRLFYINYCYFTHHCGYGEAHAPAWCRAGERRLRRRRRRTTVTVCAIDGVWRRPANAARSSSRRRAASARPSTSVCDGCERERGIRRAFACAERASRQPATQPAR